MWLLATAFGEKEREPVKQLILLNFNFYKSNQSKYIYIYINYDQKNIYIYINIKFKGNYHR